MVETSRKFQATVTLALGNVRASAKDLMDLLFLAAPSGSVLTLEAEGDDAAAAVRAIEALFQKLDAEG